MKKKLIAIMANLMVLVSACAACGGRQPAQTSNSVDDRLVSKLYIGNFDGGLKDAWLRKIADNFEAAHAETSFEEGKTGVSVEIDNVKGTIAGTGLFSSMVSSRDHVFFTEDINYYDGINQGAFADITKAVTTKLSAYGEDKTIETKMDSTLVNYYKTDDGKYYGLPFYDGFSGFFYDRDLFDEYNFYMKKDAVADGYLVNGKFSATETQISNLFVTDIDAERSVGPDGEEGTYDDGLPATYADFYALMEYMVSFGVKPFTWSGMWRDYSNLLAGQLWADHEGKANIEMLYNMSGTANTLVSVSSSGEITNLPEVEITPANAYELHKQEGKYYAMQFIKTIVSDSRYYSSKTFSGSVDQMAAQDNFVLGKFSSKLDTIGMFVEGAWWYSEAKDTINSMVATEGQEVSWENRNIAFMPLPKATREKLGKSTIYSGKKSVCVVNAKKYDKASEDMKDLIQEFIMFAHTDDSLYQFMKYTGTTRSFNVNLGEKEATLNPYAKSIYQIKKSYDIVYPYSKQTTVLNSPTFFNFEALANYSRISSEDYTHPAFDFNDNKSLSAVAYFNGMYEYYKNNWSNVYKG